MQDLLSAVLAIGSDLQLSIVLRRIAEAAGSLADARYSALAVLDEGGSTRDFITVGIDQATREALGPPP
jgi:hypothetical protein